jgi:hypothetical protein
MHHVVSRKFHQHQHGHGPRHEAEPLGHGEKNSDSVAIKIRKVSLGMMPTIRDDEVENQGLNENLKQNKKQMTLCRVPVFLNRICLLQ